jgi:hypothetical protein
VLAPAGMQLDPKVNRAKFDRELQRLVEQQSALQGRGIFLQGQPAFPIIELLFVPRHFLQVVGRPTQAGAILLPPGTVVQVEIPSIAARAFKARFDLTDYDLRAPSLEFRDPWTDDVLQYAPMFKAIEYEKVRGLHLVLLDDHPKTHRPFLCVRGVREYHEHPQHSGDDWLLYREGFSVFSVVMTLWRVSIDLIHPRLVPQPTGLQIQWAADEKA